MDFPCIYRKRTYLDRHLCCDSYDRDFPAKYYALSHFHSDHMRSLRSALAQSEAYMTQFTKDLIIAKEDSTSGLAKKSNLHGIQYNREIELPIGSLKFIDAGHILGAAQIILVNNSNEIILYTGDFQLENALYRRVNCDIMIIDATHGSPSNIRRYDTNQIMDDVIEEIKNAWEIGKNIYFKGDKVQTEFWMYLIRKMAPKIHTAFIVNEQMNRICNVFKKYHFDVGDNEIMMGSNSLKDQHFRFCYFQEKVIPPDNSVTFSIKGRMQYERGENPFEKGERGNWSIGFSDHADFKETVEYVKYSGAKKVITNGYLHKTKAYELAKYLVDEFGIDAVAMF